MTGTSYQTSQEGEWALNACAASWWGGAGGESALSPPSLPCHPTLPPPLPSHPPSSTAIPSLPSQPPQDVRSCCPHLNYPPPPVLLGLTHSPSAAPYSLSGSCGRPQRSSPEEHHPPGPLPEAAEDAQAHASHPEHPCHPRDQHNERAGPGPAREQSGCPGAEAWCPGGAKVWLL